VKRILGSLTRGWKDNTKMDLTQIICDDKSWIAPERRWREEAIVWWDITLNVSTGEQRMAISDSSHNENTPSLRIRHAVVTKDPLNMDLYLMCNNNLHSDVIAKVGLIVHTLKTQNILVGSK
jgi:hypothetical protein